MILVPNYLATSSPNLSSIGWKLANLAYAQFLVAIACSDQTWPDDWAWSAFGLLFNLFDLTFEFCLFCQVLSFRSFTLWPRTLLLNLIVNPKIIQFCLIPSFFSLQVWNKITTLCSTDRFDKFSFLTNQQQPHIKCAKPGPAGPLTRCSEVTLVCHATQTVYKRTTFPFCS